MVEYFIGLMSGTSIDAIDVALLECSTDKFQLTATTEYGIPDDLKTEILALCQTGDNEIERMARIDNELGKQFAAACLELINTHKINHSIIKAIGCHGQTIRHLPNAPFQSSLQIGNPALIAELTSITTVADFRRADIAAGGQGAPLVPAFHQAAFSHPKKKRVIVNIGGMANISILEENQVSGFDTGPGNVLLNHWIQEHINKPYDANGDWARHNNVNQELLNIMLSDPYFQQAPPKSTGREYFNRLWLERMLTQLNQQPTAGEIQASLTALTSQSIAKAIKDHSAAEEIYVCGGGARNQYLMECLSAELKMQVNTTAQLGIDPDYVEAAAFAWFAKRALEQLPSNVPAVTGARHPTILGAIYPRWVSGT